MFAYSQENGIVAIVIPAPKEHLERLFGDLTNDQYNFLIRKGVPDYAVEIDHSVIPGDRYFRDAWILEGLKIKVDMEKARNVHMNRIRDARDRKLKELDVETMKGLDVQEKKQALRDIPQTFDLSSAQTPEELKTLWPEGL